ncbi:MAG: HupE/UreJ family protein [Opitutae bacterium]|nr:HupE/UreJ family protein [Opitutae bacterium]
MYALLDGPRAELDRRMGEARERFARHFRVRADGQELAGETFAFPTVDEVLQAKDPGRKTRLPVILSAEASGTLPAGTRRIAWRFPEVVGRVIVIVERQGEEAISEPVAEGDFSTEQEITLAAPAQHAPASAALAPPAAPAPSGWRTAGRFLPVGFEHILPRGLDHVLFVLGLFLLAGRLSALLWQVTAFTLAHSVTLGLALYGVVSVPTAVVEPLIALSIVLVAVDNLRGRELRWWRVAVVFAFGLVHGFGFASALLTAGLPRADFLPALCGFNAGVELGQLAVLGLAFLAGGWWRQHAHYRRWVVVPASLCIGLIACVWTVQRLLGA